MNFLLHKELLFTILIGLLAVTFFGGFVWLTYYQPASTVFSGLLVFLGLFQLALFMIAIALIQHRFLRWLTIVLPPLIIAGFGQLQPAAIAGAGLLTIVGLVASVLVRDHLDDYVRLQPMRAFWTGSQLVIIGTILSLAGLYFPRLVDQVQTGSWRVSERSVEPLVRPLIPVVEKLLADRTAVPNQPVLLTTPAAVITKLFNQQLDHFTRQSPMLISGLILIPVFFTVWLLSPALLWPTVLIITALLWGLRRLRLIRIEVHPQPVEHLTL